MGGRLAGVALHMAALALFVAMDTLVKGLTAHYAVPQLMWARFLFSLLAAALVIRVATGSLPWRSRAPGLQDFYLEFSSCLSSAGRRSGCHRRP